MTDDTPSDELPKRLDRATVTPSDDKPSVDAEFIDTGGFVCPPSEAEEFIRRAKSAGLAESIHIEFVTSEEGFRYPPRDPSQPKPTGEPFVVLDPESQTVKPATILGKPVAYKDLGVGEGDIVLASLEEFYGAAGVLFTSGGVDTADNGDGTFTHTFEEPQGQIPKEITISGLATFSHEFEQWLGRAKNGGVFSMSATIKHDDIRRMWETMREQSPRLTAISTEQGWDNFSRAFHYRPSKRGEWRLPSAPALISEEFSSSCVYFFDSDDVALRYTANYNGVTGRFTLFERLRLSDFENADVLASVKNEMRQNTQRKARIISFLDPTPCPDPSGNTRKAKRLHREAKRLYKWKKKWAERQIQDEGK